jgi:hypothetical protein
MYQNPYVIVQNGHVELDYRTQVIDLDILNDDPALVADSVRVEKLLGLLNYLRSEGEPVQPYVSATEEWLREYADIHAEFSTEELPSRGEDG